MEKQCISTLYQDPKRPVAKGIPGVGKEHAVVRILPIVVVYVLPHACLSSHFMSHNIKIKNIKINEEGEQKLGGSWELHAWAEFGQVFRPFQ